MKIHINVDPLLQDTEITISCNRVSSDVEKIIAILRVLDLKLTGTKDKETYILDASNVLYIDSVDKKTFIYTGTDVYETSLKLYELEEQLASNDFLRVSKACILNFNQIKSLKADIDGKMLVIMNNGERVLVSRQYAVSIKRKLGLSK